MHADSYYMENEYINENLRNSSCFKVSRQVSSPETISDLLNPIHTDASEFLWMI